MKKITRKNNFVGKKINFRGTTYASIKKAAKTFGIEHGTVWWRLKQGRTIE